MPASSEEFKSNKFWYIYFSNTSSAIRRETWEQIPFDRVDFAEDAVWAEKVLLAGYTLIFEPA
jgi:rhamnosyltransferase